MQDALGPAEIMRIRNHGTFSTMVNFAPRAVRKKKKNTYHLCAEGDMVDKDFFIFVLQKGFHFQNECGESPEDTKKTDGRARSERRSASIEDSGWGDWKACLGLGRIWLSGFGVSSAPGS